MGGKSALLRFLAILGIVAVASGCTGTAPTAAPAHLQVNVVYPTASSKRQMGQSLKPIIQVLDEQGNVVTDARVTLSVMDPSGEAAGTLTASFGSGDVYRTEAWAIPHRLQAGSWSLDVQAGTGGAIGTATAAFQVVNSVSEDLLYKYGFWVEAPTLKGINPDLFKEQGDAQNGVIIWGGLLPVQHIFVENWLEVQWRQGKFDLASAADVRSFMLNTLGQFGFYPTRALGPFEQTKFKGWDAWQVKGRGQYSRYDEQWMIFYAPESDKTYALGTMVVLPPVGIDPHATLRDGFEVHPEVHAAGVAPAALPHLLPPPELSGPELGTRFMGDQKPILLTWKPLKTLSADEYYQVKVDYDYSETNTTVLYTTRDTQVTLPESLYQTPNCGVFNWQVTLMRQTGTDNDGQPKGVALSYNSLYWYVEWLYPAGSAMPFKTRCPNPQT
jgi:hypothetical protein